MACLATKQLSPLSDTKGVYQNDTSQIFRRGLRGLHGFIFQFTTQMGVI